MDTALYLALALGLITGLPVLWSVFSAGKARKEKQKK